MDSDHPGDLQYCQIHKSMLSCLETVIRDVHVDLTSIDTEVNKCLPSCVPTTFFFKNFTCNPRMFVTEIANTHLADYHSATCSTCVPELPSVVLNIDAEVGRLHQYVNFIHEKLNSIPTITTKPLLHMVNSRSSLVSSVSRSKIRTNPSLPVLQRSPKVLDLSQEFYEITSVSQQITSSPCGSYASQNDSVYQNRPQCLCCSKCVEAFHWLSDTVGNKIQFLKDQCNNLKYMLMALLKEDEKELMVKLAQKRKVKQEVSNCFSRLEGLGLQGLTICSNIHNFQPVNSDQSSSSFGNQTCTRYAADGQSCDEEATSLVSASASVQSISASTSEESCSIPINIAFQLSNPPNTSASSQSDVVQTPENAYEEPITVLLNIHENINSPKTFTRPVYAIPDSPMPELLEFQRRRSNSINQYDSVPSHANRRRSNTISHPVSAATKPMMNNCDPYSTIQETVDEDDQLDHALLHVKSNIAVTFPETKLKKMKKSKSSIMVHASKLKNYITNKFKRKSWGSTADKKSAQAGYPEVQFFEYDFSDDGEDNGSVHAATNNLDDLSILTGTVNTLTSQIIGTTNTFHMKSNGVTEMTFTSPASSLHSWLHKEVANIEGKLNNSTNSFKTDSFDQLFSTCSQYVQKQVSRNMRTNKATKTSFLHHVAEGHVHLVLPPRSAVGDLSEFLPARSLLDSKCTSPEENDLPEPAVVNPSCSDQQSSNNKQGNNMSGSSRKRLMFDTVSQSRLAAETDSIFNFHDDSSFDVLQGYASFRKLQKMSSTPFHLPNTTRKATPSVASQCSSITNNSILPYQEPELLTILCKDQPSVQGRQNMKKLCNIKPYLLQGRMSIAYLLYLINNYPHNYVEMPGYDYISKTISMQMLSFVSSQTDNPHIFARNLVWQMFTLSQLFGGKTKSGQNTDSLDEDIIMAVRNATLEQYGITNHVWQSKCVPFIHRSINYLFNKKLRSPVFRAFFQQSVC